MATAVSRVGYPTFEDAPFVNEPILILDGGSENYPIQNKWIRYENISILIPISNLQSPISGIWDLGPVI